MNQLASIGGVFALLVWVHFVVDWIFQTHYEAMNKTKNNDIRSVHCLKYAVGFVPVLFLIGARWPMVLFACAVLYLSHYWEDTYKPVIWWMRHVRQVPGLKDEAAVMTFLSTNLGFMLLIAVDQIVHITVLVPIAWMVVG